MGVMIRFECGQEDRMGDDLGPFEFVQHTYNAVRLGPTGDEEIAHFTGDGWWETKDGERWSDVVIWDADKTPVPQRRALVQFTRSHEDDDEYVCSKYGPYPGAEAYGLQLLAELADGGVHTEGAEIVTKTLRSRPAGLDRDNYVLHIWLPAGNVVHQTTKEFAEYLQLRGYDEGGCSGWFEVLVIV